MAKKNWIIMVLLVMVALTGCARRTVVVEARPAPPPLKVEVKTARPYPRAVWVPGHWQWKNRRRGYVWVPGHWR